MTKKEVELAALCAAKAHVERNPGADWIEEILYAKAWRDGFLAARAPLDSNPGAAGTMADDWAIGRGARRGV